MKLYHTYIFTLLFVGCSSNLSPNLKFADQLPETWNTPLPKEESYAGKWWEVFNDTLFNQFFSEFRDRNPDLLSISQQIESSNLLAKINGATLTPSVSATTGGGRRLQNLSAFGFSLSSLGLGGESTDSSESDQVVSFSSDNYNATIAMQWEIDIWGKLRNQRKAAFKNFEATQNELAYLRFSLSTQFATSYYAAVEAEMQYRLAQEITASLQGVRDVVSERYGLGLTSSLDLRLAEASLANSKLQLVDRSIQKNRTLRSLESILGLYPSATIQVSAELPSSIPPIVAGIPSDLIKRRPDVIAAVNKIEAASYEHAQSKRNLFPSFSLTASGGTSASELKDVLNGDYSVWNLGANISAPIFQGRRLRNNVLLKEAQFNLAELEALKIMIRAFSEVEQALFIQHEIILQLDAVKTAEEQARAAYDLAFDRYQKGLVNLITVLNSQNQWRNSQSIKISIQNLHVNSYTGLQLALGGEF
jgi:NodT family efflux transporter outer membrane factor (OMF) lipoprotein